MNDSPLYDVVIHKSGELVQNGLSLDQATEFARDWNSRSSLETWVRYEPSRTHLLPSLEQIREACLAIQATWSDYERRQRARLIHWTVPAVRCAMEGGVR